MSKHEPRALAEAAARTPALPAGDGERFSGYGVMGMTFASGHCLALRHFPASSIGPGYRAVWHRDPDGRWVVYADAPPTQSCARYLGAALAESKTARVTIAWNASRSMSVLVDDVLAWSMELADTVATRLMSVMGAHTPDALWRSTTVLRGMGAVAGPLLSVGHVRLTGTMPNGQRFRANPRRVWSIPKSDVTLQGEDLGPQGPLPRQERLGDFWLPQRAIFFADATARFTATDPSVIESTPWPAATRRAPERPH